MTGKHYRDSESPNTSKLKGFRLDPSITATLSAVAQSTNTSETAIVNAALADYFVNNAATPTVSFTNSVMNYSSTLATVRDQYDETIAKLSGTPEADTEPT